MQRALFFLFFLSTSLCLGQQTYVLDTQYPVHDLQSELRVAVDSLDNFSPEQLLSDSTITFSDRSQFPRLLDNEFTYWGKIQLLVKGEVEGWTLQLEDRYIGVPAWGKSNGKVDVYVYLDEERLVHKKTGVEYPKRERDPAAHWTLNQISLADLPEGKPINLLIRIEGNSLGYPPYFNLSARDADHRYYHQLFAPMNAFNLFMFGITFITFLYHFLQFLYLRERVFLWFSVWSFFTTLTMAMTAGLVIGAFTQFRFPFWLLIANSIVYTFWFFGRAFIGTQKKYPVLDKLILGLAFFILAEIILMVLYVLLFDPPVFATRVGVHYLFLNGYTIINVVLAIVLLFKKDPFARYFGFGALAGSAALVLGIFWAMGLIRINFDPFALALFLQVIIYSFGIAYRRQVLTQQAQLEKLEAQKTRIEMKRIKDLDEIKTRFFANISHEFRTPLALISGPLEQARQKALKEEQSDSVSVEKRSFDIIKKNTHRLNNLVNQLLELSKLESGRIFLSLQRGGLISFIRSILFSFESMAEQKNINLVINLPEENYQAFYDKDKLEKILSNILSNAFKYTPPGGTITTIVDVDERYLSIEVSDTGKGIAREDIKHIFERFYRVEGTEEKGSGIGLALTKELVELHQGLINVESRKDRGTTFKIKLPITLKGLPESNRISTEEQEIERSERRSTLFEPVIPTPAGSVQTKNQAEHLPVVLLVEDNVDLQYFISEILEPHYQILTASDGEQGERMAIEHVPDLIISDVMMPKKDGYEMCSSLKRNTKTSHIPIIMLTAKARQEDKIEGLLQGVDSYLVKPFDGNELLLQIKNLVEAREKIWSHFKSMDMLLTDDLEVHSLEDQFIQEVFKTIKANLDNEQFGVEDLVRSLGFSRSQLHRKLKALIGKSANQLIVEIRLNEAHRMLKQKAGTVTEVAFSVGYSNLSYFSKSFKNKFGMLPSKVQ
ncbi:MAG TPA: ATP-binding protein [Saprospiraceae bacterium]|nr:ATP-binding protein [Saprospiraceae bacterium]